MKKLLLALMATLMMAQPVLAHEERRGRAGVDAGSLILGGVLGAIIVGAATENDRRYREDYRGYGESSRNPYAYDRYNYPRRPRYYEHYCVTEQHVDRYGVIYFTRTCQ